MNPRIDLTLPATAVNVSLRLRAAVGRSLFALPMLVILGFTLWRLTMATVVQLTPQEAYYWTWSRFPDLSYFDHPPLASYAIGLTTAVFGSTVFGVKMAAVTWSLGWNLLWLRLITDLFGDRRLTVWSLLALNATLLYELYGFGPTPDGPLLFGWVGTIWAVWRATQTGSMRWWLVAGLFLGIAWLAKYSGVLLVPAVALFLLSVPGLRRWFGHPGPWLAVVIAALVFSPVLIWNAQHDWVSLSFQSSRRVGEMGELKLRFLVLLVVTQTLLLTPWVMGLSLRGLWTAAARFCRGRSEPAIMLLFCSAAVPLLVFGAASLFTNSKSNWLIPAWWSLVVLGLRHGLESPATAWRRLGVLSSLVLVLVFSVAATRPDLKLPGDLNIFSGWPATAKRVDALVAGERADGREAFVFSPNYKISSLLWFHRPSRERTYAADIWSGRALQYDYFPKTKTMQGATGFLVISDQAQSQVDLEEIRRRFRSLSLVETIEARSGDKLVRRIQVWRGEGYAGMAITNGALP